MKRLSYIVFTLVILLTAQAFAETDSLRGLKTAKFVVDLNQGSSSVLLLRLKLIEQTMNEISANGIKSNVVIAVRGNASRFMTDTDKYLTDDDKVFRNDIYLMMKKLKFMGARLEQCNMALFLLKIDPNDVYKDIKVVPNGYVSLIGYQNQGYALLPME